MKKIYKLSSYFAFIVGVILVLGGVWGIAFTHKNVTREKIVTPSDASLPNKPVSGPRTLKSQADIIREHVLKSTGGQTYAEMPRQIVKIDDSGNPVIDSNGNPVLIENTARNIWVTATALTTALNLGIITYAFSSFVLLLGLISLWNGYLFLLLSKQSN